MGRGAAGRTTPGLVVAASVAAAVLVVANVSSLNVALPQLSRELGASQLEVHWMIDIYAVFLAALLLPAGAIGDRFGRRPLLLAGIVVLVVANLATMWVDTPGPVIAIRAISGVGAALVFPATLSTITATLPDEQRGRGVAMWTAAVMFGGIVGVLGSGLLVENFWWGSVFVGMAGASAAVLAFCWAFVPDSADPEDANLDPVGAVLSILAVGGLVLGVIEGPVEGWTSTLALLGLAVGVMALAGFVWWEYRHPAPLLDVRLFANRGVRSGSFSIFIQFTVAFGFFFLTVPYLAFVRGFGPLDTGLGLMPVAIGLFPGAAAAIPATRRFGRRVVGVAGLAVLAVGMLLGIVIDVGSSFVVFAAVMALFGLGIGLASPPATESIVESLPPAKQGVASALNDVLREFGAAIGIAAIGSAFNNGYRSQIDQSAGLPAEVFEAVRETPAAAAVIAPQLGAEGAALLFIVQEAVIEGWAQGLWLTAGVVVVGVIGYGSWAPSLGARAETPDQIDAMGQSAVEVAVVAGSPREVEAVDVAWERVIGLGFELRRAAGSGGCDAVVAVLGDGGDLREVERVANRPDGSEADVLLFVVGERAAVAGWLSGSSAAARWVGDRQARGVLRVVAAERNELETHIATELAASVGLWAAHQSTVELTRGRRRVAESARRGHLAGAPVDGA